MSDGPRPSRLAATSLAVVIGLMLAACTGAAAPSASTPSASGTPPAPSASAPGSGPAAAIDVDTLLAAAGANDGQTVRVTGNFLADETSAQLCAVLMESYPPQCGGGVRLTGPVPADTLAALDTTKEPDLKRMWWGYVTVTGMFHASGDDGRPSLDIQSIDLVEG